MRLNIYLYFDRVDMPKREYKWRRTKCHTNRIAVSLVLFVRLYCIYLFHSNFDGLAVHKQRLPWSDKRRFRWGRNIFQRNVIEAPIRRTFEWVIHSIVEFLVSSRRMLTTRNYWLPGSFCADWKCSKMRCSGDELKLKSSKTAECRGCVGRCSSSKKLTNDYSGWMRIAEKIFPTATEAPVATKWTNNVTARHI